MAQAGRAWLSRAAPELVARLRGSADEAFDCDLLIVGSGYGGAVAAARAAGHKVRGPDGSPRPARVWVLERGSEYLPGMFPSRFSELAGHVRFDTQDGKPARGRPEGLFDARLGKDVCALLGNGLGGGSLINAGVMEKPDAVVFARHWPKAITPEQLEGSYEKARAMLAPRPVPADKECSKLHVLDALIAPDKAERCGVTVHWQDERSAADVPMQACTLCGDCLTGCNQSAKGSLDTNYLAFARARGVEMFCGGTVRTIARGNGCWQVRCEYTDRKLGPENGSFAVRAKRVVLAAGSLGSTEILLRSQTESLRFANLGSRFSANGDKITAGAKHVQRVGSVGDQETDPADGMARRVGPTITGLIRVPRSDDQAPFALEEFAVPAGLRNVYGEIVALLAALAGDRIGAADPFAVTDSDIDHISLYGSMGDDGAAGKVCLPEVATEGRGSEGVRVDWPGLRKHPLFEGVGKWLSDRLDPAIAVPNPLPSNLDVSALLPALTVHPLGGCPMADGHDAGTVDHCGRVFDPQGGLHDGLVVLDGSIVPCALGINPAFTIAALAERAMPQLLRDWEWQADAGQAVIVAPRPRGRRVELPARDVVWSIRERVQGLFSVDNRTFYWARMEIEFEEIPGLRRALALMPRAVAVRRATLALYGARECDDEFTVDDPDARAPQYQATLAGSVELFAPMPDSPPDDDRTRLVYRLSVQSVQGDGAAPLAVGGRLEGVKTLGRPRPEGDKSAPRDVSPWRQLSEMQMCYDGRPVGRWVLDLADLAQRRDPLLRVTRLSSMPDMLDDAGAVVLYVLRRMSTRLVGYAGEFIGLEASDLGLDERWPTKGQVKPLPGGARLTRYAPADSDRAAALPPVLLIHGLGSSGASFTDAALPQGLMTTLRSAGRDVWVLDVRSSTGNEFARHEPVFEAARRWTVDGVARDDVPAAIDEVLRQTQAQQVDVFAHCMGAVMFCLAALGKEEMRGKVRAAVLSQVGPLIRFSPMNRLRGYLASYLQQFLRIDTVDTAPDFVSHIDGCTVSWERRPGGISERPLQLLVDLLLFTFPYPDDDDEAGRQQSEPLKESDFRRVRHRGDAIFGQLFELANVSDDVLLRLQAFMGWVMVPMLAQAIHFARHNMLTDSTGRNTVLHQTNFAQRFAFPVLILHGRRNRVFDWRGSLASWKLLTQLRAGNESAPPEPVPTAPGALYGRGTATQLAVFDAYGHLDCLIGKDAHQHVFPLAAEFLAGAHRLPNPGVAKVDPQFEAPWIGPMLGWLQREESARDAAWWNIKVLVHAALRRAGTKQVIVMPMVDQGGALVPLADLARVLPWRPVHEKAHHALLDLRIAESALRMLFDSFAVLTVHDDLDLKPDVEVRRRRTQWSKDDGAWVRGGMQRALQGWIRDERNQAALAASVFTLARKLEDATDRGQVTPPPQRLSFALASCQYPPGLFDQRPAAAAYERLLADAAAPAGPQFLVLCGDQVYLDETAGVFDPIAAGPGAAQDAAIDRSYELNWQLPPMRRTVARLPVVAMFDDHEVEDNWKGLDGEPDPPREHSLSALQAYERHQGLLNPVRPLVDDPAAGYSFVAYPGGVPMFVLDTRSRRSLRDAINIGDARIVPAAVMDSLCRRLRDAPAPFVKLIVSPSPILPPERFDGAHPAARLRSDSWSGYPASTVALLSWIRTNDIRRVIVLSGDAHLSSVCSFEFTGPHGLSQVVSIVSSGLYTPWPFANQRPDELVLDGPVDLGWQHRPFEGTVRLHAMSAHPGYAIVSVTQLDDGSAWLDVSLRAANGATTDCRVALR